MLNFKALRWALLGFAPIFVIAFLLSRYDYAWTDWRPATCMPDMCFCETARPGMVAQPANTWSSLGFVLVGLMILFAEPRWRTSASHDTTPASFRQPQQLVYGLAVICIGLGSTFYHASLTFVGQFCDVMGMYLLGVFILLYNFAQVRKVRAAGFAAAYVGLNVMLGVVLVVLPELRRYLFAVLILSALVLAYWPRGASAPARNKKYLAQAAFMLLLAFIFFLLDLTKIFCWPESWLQGHALWHLGGACAAGLLYQHYVAPEAQQAALPAA